MKTFWSFVLFANIVFKYVYVGKGSLIRKVKNKTLKVMREGESKALEESVENENMRRQVAVVFQDDMWKPYALEEHCKVSTDEEDGVDIFQYYNEEFKDALEFNDAIEDVADEEKEVYKIEKLSGSEDKKEGESEQPPFAKVNKVGMLILVIYVEVRIWISNLLERRDYGSLQVLVGIMLIEYRVGKGN